MKNRNSKVERQKSNKEDGCAARLRLSTFDFRLSCHLGVFVMPALVALIGCSKPAAQPVAGLSAAVEKQDLTAKSLPPAKRRFAYYQAYQQGLSRVNQGNYAGAIGPFETAVSMEPDSTAAMLSLGACYESVGDPLTAVQWYRKIINLNPIDSDALANLGTAYIKLYHREHTRSWRDMAQAAWRQSLALNPDQPDVREFMTKSGASGADALGG